MRSTCIFLFVFALSLVAVAADDSVMILDGTLPPDEITTGPADHSVQMTPDGQTGEMVIDEQERFQMEQERYISALKSEAIAPFFMAGNTALVQRLAAPQLMLHDWKDCVENIRLVLYKKPVPSPQPEILSQSYIQMASTLLLEKEEVKTANSPEPEKGVKSDENHSEAEKTAENKEAAPAPESPEPVKQAPPLSPEMQKLCEQIDTTVKANSKRILSLQTNTPADLISYGFVYGADTLVYKQSPQFQRNRPQPAGNQPIYAIGSLCWNYPAMGLTVLRADNGRLIPKVGAGMQRKPGVLLAMLAAANIDDKYEIKVDEKPFTVSDLVRFEKENCSQGSDMSLVLIGLSFYCKCDEQWTNEFGETWSIPKMVYSELCRPADQGSSDMTDQLFGLASAVKRFEKEGVALEGPMSDAKKYLDSYLEFTISAANDQGLWHPQFFLYKGTGTDAEELLYSNGHIFRFLAFTLPQERLGDPQVVKSATALLNLVNRLSKIPCTTERDNESLATAIQALDIYSQRLAGH